MMNSKFVVAALGAVVGSAFAQVDSAVGTAPSAPSAAPVSMQVPVESGPSRPTPIVSAPVASTGALAMGASERSYSVLSVGAAPAVAPGATEDVSVPFVLSSDQHPWPLLFPASMPRPVLYLSLPPVAEARLYTPGAAVQAARMLQRDINRYLTDLQGAGAQQRARQFETLSQWMTELEKQRRTLSSDAWQVYQFTRDSRPKVVEYQRAISAQADDLRALMQETSAVLQDINARVAVMPTVEAQDEWYQLMVTLRDGVLTYQRQVDAADKRTAGLIDGYLRATPPPLRPAGPVPRQQAQAAAPAPTPTVAPAAPVMRAPAMEPKPVALQDNSSMSGIVVGLMGALAVFFGFRFWTKRRSNKVSAAAE